MNTFVEGELIGVVELPAEDNIKNVKWVTQDRQVIPVPELADSHLRNIALFLMDMGYTPCLISQEKRILWLRVLLIEWKRRMSTRQNYGLVYHG